MRNVVVLVLRIAGIGLAFGLQVYLTRLHAEFQNQLMLLNYGQGMFYLALIETLLGWFSGVILIAALPGPKSFTPISSWGWAALIFLGLPPAFGIYIKMALSLGNNFLTPAQLPLWEWAVNSYLPPVWFGLLIGYIVTGFIKSKLAT